MTLESAMTTPTLGQTLQLIQEWQEHRIRLADACSSSGYIGDELAREIGAASRIDGIDHAALARQAAQHAQTLREMAVAASMPRPDAVRQARIDKLRAVADWLAPEPTP